MRVYFASALAGTLLLGTTLLLATSAIAATGEYDNMCAMGLALGKEVKTDCTINGQIDGKTYCFGNEDAKTEFMKDPKGNLAKAEAHRMSKK